MGMILSLTTLAFWLMVQVVCYHAISAPIGTSPEIILKSGEEGILQCGFKGKAQAVYWTHQTSSSKQVILIKLDMLQQTGQRRISGYGEGRYNISEDFSLIIHGVTEEDEGRYTCEVLESRTCSLLINYTFVSVVGMHSEVVLKSGEDGTLTCDIKGEAHVVYWAYQSASSKPVLLVRLEFLQQQVGQRRVALHAEERYNITDDFSLIIRDVSSADEGRYTCEILEVTGSVASKHSDVSVPEVKMVPSVFLESGKKATITCGYERTVYSVHWTYENTTSPMELLVVLDEYYQVGDKSGPGYEEGRFDINDDYSLVIHSVEAENEGRYTCEVTDFESGLLLRNHTDVHTIVIAERPFVRIAQCEDEISADEINAPCVLHATSDDPSIELTCTVLGAKPMVHLTWISSKSYNMSEYWKLVMNASTLTARKQGNGIFDQTSTVYVDTSFFTSDIQHFTCVAEGLAVDGKASFTISVYLAQGLLDSPDVTTVNITRISVISAVATLAFTLILILIVILLIRKPPCNGTGKSTGNKEGGDTSDEADGNEGSKLLESKKTEEQKAIEIEQKSNDIIEEIKNQVKDSTPLYLGVFGDREAGKSSFIDSLIRAFTGDVACPEERQSIRETVWRRTIKWPSEFIAICEIEDMKNANPEELKKLLQPIGDGDKRPDDVIHYPIIVYDIGQHERGGSIEKSLSSFSKAVKRNISEYPILVLTHITPSDISERARRSIARRLSSETNIPIGDIFFIGIDKANDSEHEDEILLEILLKCVKRVKSETAKQQSQDRKNVKVRWRRVNLVKQAFKLPTSEPRGENEEKTQEPSESHVIDIS